MCQLLGGEGRISDSMRGWSDGFIVNLGLGEYKAEDNLNLRGENNLLLQSIRPCHTEFLLVL